MCKLHFLNFRKAFDLLPPHFVTVGHFAGLAAVLIPYPWYDLPVHLTKCVHAEMSYYIARRVKIRFYKQRRSRRGEQRT